VIAACLHACPSYRSMPLLTAARCLMPLFLQTAPPTASARTGHSTATPAGSSAQPGLPRSCTEADLTAGQRQCTEMLAIGSGRVCQHVGSAGPAACSKPSTPGAPLCRTFLELARCLWMAASSEMLYIDGYPSLDQQALQQALVPCSCPSVGVSWYLATALPLATHVRQCHAVPTLRLGSVQMQHT